MSVIKLIGFAGEIPRLQPRQLPEAAAQMAYNCRLESGALVPFNRLRFVQSFASFGLPVIRTIYLHQNTWLAWATPVNAAPGPVATDRLYYTGDGKPKMRVSSTVYDLALPYPTAALTATATGTGTGDVESRVYVYTSVTSFGEESEPCAASNIMEWQSGKIVTLSGFQAAPAGRGITLQRIYRSQTNAAGDAQLYFIDERPASAADYVDAIAVNAFAEVLISADYNAPPDDLAGLIALPNGMMAGFVGKTLYFCEPYKPHAWPEKYTLTTDYSIVALGAYGNTVILATEGTPYYAQGTAPENMIMERIEINLPCVNAQGMVDLGYAVAYPSSDGLVVASSGSARVATDQLFTRDDWIRLNPASLVSGQFSGKYFTSYAYTENGEPITGSFLIDLTGTSPFVSRTSVRADALHYNIENSILYVLQDQSVYEFDSPLQSPDVMTWKSKLFVLPSPDNFGAIEIDAGELLTPAQETALAAEIAAIIASNASIFALASLEDEINGQEINYFEINGDPLEAVPQPTYISATIYADKQFVATITQVNRTVRLPGGFTARYWEIELTGTKEVYEVAMATTAAELRDA